MGLLRLRALMVVACALAVVGLTGLAYSEAELEAIASNELVPEISAAAGTALGSFYAKTKTVEYLEDLAVTGRTIGLRTAASVALSILFRTKTEAELMEIAGGTGPELVRAAAIEPLQVFLVPKKAADLKALAADATKTHEVRLAAAKAYYFKTRATLNAAKLETQAVTNDSAELAYAAGGLLGGFYVSFNPKTQAELEALAINGSSEGLRVAGSVALVTFLVDLSVDELQTKLLSIFGITSAEYRAAYQAALAVQFAS